MKPVEICNQGHDIKHHPRTSQLAPPSNMVKRRNSWSSVESTSSNRTDISTVVNAPTSMHNTAPGSPDPDGSEASDSDISDQENEDNEPNLSESFSHTGSPHLAQKRRANHHQVPQQQYQGQKRWPTQHEERHLLDGQKPVNQIPYSDDCCNNHPNMRENQNNMRPPPQEDQVKSLIKMAKEKFGLKSPVQSGCSDIPNDPTRSPQMHVNRYPPHQQPCMMPQGGGVYYQQPMEHQGGVFYDKHHPNESAQRYHPQHHDANHKQNYHNYQHQNANYPGHLPKQAVLNDAQQSFSAHPMAPLHALGRQPPRMQSIPESQAPPMMHTHNSIQGPADIQKNGHSHGHQGGPVGSIPYSRPLVNSQQVNHVPQQFYGEPMNLHPHGCAPTQDEEVSLYCYCTFLIFSLP